MLAKESRSEALKDLQKHPGSCRDEDTLGLSLQLAPPIRRQARETGPRWVKTNSTVLPEPVRRNLWAKLKRETAMDTLGPIRSEYGVWILSQSTPEIKPGATLDSEQCLSRLQAKIMAAREADLIQSEIMRMASKTDGSGRENLRTVLFQRASEGGGEPEAAYQNMLKKWVAKNLRFTRDM
jgi:hypothetical protein